MIRVAVIGAGIFVRETYIPNLLANSTRVKLTAILSKTSASIEECLLLIKDGGDVTRFIGSAGEEEFFIQAKDICDAVIIVVPIPLLAKYVERCLLVGLHVLSEKPVAMTSLEARKLISLYRQEQRPCTWHVAENYRLEPAVCYASEIVQKYHLRPKTFSLVAIRQQSATSKFAVTPWRYYISFSFPMYQTYFYID